MSKVVTVINSVDAPLMMSSKEIAKLTGKEHKHVVRDIRVMMGEIEDGPDLDHVEIITDTRGYTSEIRLNRELTQTLVTGYSVPLRLAVVRRLNELEAQVAKPVPMNLDDPAALRGLLLGYTEKVMLLEHKVAEDAPKVRVFTKLVESKEEITFQQFCTKLNLHQKNIKPWLRDIGWLRAHQFEVNPLPTAKAVDAGYCVIKYFETSSGRIKESIKFTRKAEAYIELKAPDEVRKPVRKSRKKRDAE